MVDFKIELQGISEVRNNLLLDQEKVRRALNSAVNKMITQLNTEVVRALSAEYNLKSTDIRKNLRITQRARGNEFEAVLVGSGRGIALYKFGAKQEGVASKGKQVRYTRRSTASPSGLGRYGGQVSYEVIKGRREILNTSPKPFIAQMPSGHIGVFHRVGKDRKPIKQEFRAGIGLVMGSKKILERLDKFVDQKFSEILNHELQYYLNLK